MRADDTGAEDHHLAWSHAGHPAQQDAAASLRPLQVVRSNLHRQPPGDLAHRPEDRKASVRTFHGFVSDGKHPPIQQGFGQGPVGREMEIGEEGLDRSRSEEHTSELQSLAYLVCRLLLEKKKKMHNLDTFREGFRGVIESETAVVLPPS